MIWILPVLASALTNVAADKVHTHPQVPVVIGSDSISDACSGVGVVKGLNPSGDGFLAVRDGPGAAFARIDKLHNGERVYLCVESGSWYGIVYTKTGQTCNVSTPWRESSPYTGPCRSGWVHKRWIGLFAG